MFHSVEKPIAHAVREVIIPSPTTGEYREILELWEKQRCESKEEISWQFVRLKLGIRTLSGE